MAVPMVHLQSLGLHPAKPVSKLVVGDVVVFNYGYLYTITAITPRTARSVAVTMVDSNGTEYTQVKRLSTLMAVR